VVTLRIQQFNPHERVTDLDEMDKVESRLKPVTAPDDGNSTFCRAKRQINASSAVAVFAHPGIPRC